MVNIFAAFKKADGAAIAMQVAQLQSLTISNIMSPHVKKAGKLLAGAANWLIKKTGGKTKISEPNVVEIQEQIQKNYLQLKNKSRAELDDLFCAELSKRVKVTAPNKILLSNEIIAEAAKNYDDIGENLTNAQKADAIAQRFYERIREKINAELKKQNPIQAAQMEQTLDENISQMNAIEREQMRQALRVDKLTGKMIRNTLLKAGLPALAIGSTGGFGVYLATTTILHAVFTTALGITLPFAAYTTATSAVSILTGPVGWGLVAGVAAYQIVSGKNKINREILSQCIYLAFAYNGRNFAPLEEELAAWKSAKITAENVQKNLQARIKQLEKNNASMISESELRAQLALLRDELDRQNELARLEIEREFEARKKQIELNAANKTEMLERALIEKNELIERQKIASAKNFDELKENYRRKVHELNAKVEKMRGENGELIAKLEKNRSNEMLRTREIPQKLHEALQTAQQEIDIMSPWLNYVADNFVEDLRAALSRGVVVKIHYGIGRRDNRLNDSQNKIRDLQASLNSPNLKFKFGNEHSKLFICDEKFYVIGSFNTLSYSGELWGEIGELSTDKNNLLAYREKFFNF